jgi:hypothetical protein
MRKQRSGLHKNIGAIFQNSDISAAVPQKEEWRDTDKETPVQNSTVEEKSKETAIADAQPSSPECVVSLEDALDTASLELQQEEERQAAESALMNSQTDEDLTEITGFRRIVKLFFSLEE